MLFRSNVAADGFVNSAMTGANGGLVVVSADDPSMHSSQNEQDSRYYAQFAFIPTMEPSSQQEAYDMMDYAFSFSEKYRIPMLMRMVTRLAHSRAVVQPGEVKEENGLTYPENTRQWVLMPANSKVRYRQLVQDWAEFEKESDNSPFNRYTDGKDKSKGIIANGIAYNYVMECFPEGCPFPVLKISQYPLPMGLIKRMADECESILVIEEGQPFIEERLRGLLGTPVPVTGRLTGLLPRTGELNPDLVRAALGLKELDCQAPSQVVMPDRKSVG